MLPLKRAFLKSIQWLQLMGNHWQNLIINIYNKWKPLVRSWWPRNKSWRRKSSTCHMIQDSTLNRILTKLLVFLKNYFRFWKNQRDRLWICSPTPASTNCWQANRFWLISVSNFWTISTTNPKESNCSNVRFLALSFSEEN